MDESFIHPKEVLSFFNQFNFEVLNVLNYKNFPCLVRFGSASKRTQNLLALEEHIVYIGEKVMKTS